MNELNQEVKERYITIVFNIWKGTHIAVRGISRKSVIEENNLGKK